MDENLKSQRISVLVHLIAAIAMGFISLLIASSTRALYAIIIGFAVLFVIGFLTERMVGRKKGVKWWLSNGGIIYILIWTVVWVLLFNIF